MSDCPKIHKCPFHYGRLARYSPQVLSSIRRAYCTGAYESCARYVVYSKMGSGQVPEDLSPMDDSAAERIIAREGKPGWFAFGES